MKKRQLTRSGSRLPDYPVRNRKHAKINHRYSFTVIELLVLIICIFLLAGMLLPALNQAREKARRISCSSNLKQIGLSLKQYSIDYSDRFPHLPGAAGLELLRKNDYLTDYGIYACPSTQTTRGSGTFPLTQGNFFYANCDYAFAAPMMEGDSNTFGRADSGIAADIFRVDISKTNNCSAPNHRDFGNILFHDGHVSGFAGAEWYSYHNRGGSYMWPNVAANSPADINTPPNSQSVNQSDTSSFFPDLFATVFFLALIGLPVYIVGKAIINLFAKSTPEPQGTAEQQSPKPLSAESSQEPQGAAEWICKQCNQAYQLDDVAGIRFCANCGCRQTCPQCHSSLERNSKFCHVCGTNIQETNPALAPATLAAPALCCSCRAELPLHTGKPAPFCPQCGKPQPLRCPTCGTNIRENDTFCTHCGLQLLKR